MSTEDENTIHISVSMPKSMAKRLEQEAKDMGGIKVSPLLRMIITAHWNTEDLINGLSPEQRRKLLRKVRGGELLGEIWRRGFYEKDQREDGNE